MTFTRRESCCRGAVWRKAGGVGVVLGAHFVLTAATCSAQTVTASVDVGHTLAVMPDYGLGIHTSVYDNSLQYTGTTGFNQLNGMLDAAGVNTLRYPGGGYADVYHFSVSRPGGLTGNGLTPWWGQPANYGYMGAKTDFGNFVKLLDATQSKSIITVNTGGALRYASANQLGVPTHGGQPLEAAAWVAYANGDAALYGTPQDVTLGMDAEGNDWKTVGYWAKLRASTPAEFSNWATAGGVYDSRNAFLAIDRDSPVGIKYWEVGNETFGTGYYGGAAGDTGYALNYAAPYDGSARNGNPALSPDAYGAEINAFDVAMKAVDPTIKVGAVLNTPPADYSWGPGWNDGVLSHADATGKVADNVDFVIAHWYPSGTSNTIVNMPRQTIPVMLDGTTAGQDSGTNAGLRDSVAKWRTDGNGKALDIFITETDGYGGTVQRSDGLFAADEYATFMDNGVSNVDWLELHNGSFLADGTNAPNFAYWGVQSVHLLASPGDDLVGTTTSDVNVRVHAALQADGTVAVMVINMNGTGTRTVNLSINGGTWSPLGVQYQTDGDSTLSATNLTTLGNSFSTTSAARTLQVFLLSLLGDYDHNGVVDGSDLTLWTSQFGQTGAQLGADGNGDGVVDGADLLIWQQNLGNSSAAMVGALASSAVVPEPSTAAIIACGLIGLCSNKKIVRRLRRRGRSHD